MRQKKELWARFGRHLDIPREALPGGFGLALSGQKELTVNGCRRILDYSPECILLSLGKTALRIEGSDLLCTVFGGRSVTVAGHIRAICFEEGGASESED